MQYRLFSAEDRIKPTAKETAKPVIDRLPDQASGEDILDAL